MLRCCITARGMLWGRGMLRSCTTARGILWGRGMLRSCITARGILWGRGMLRSCITARGILWGRGMLRCCIAAGGILWGRGVLRCCDTARGALLACGLIALPPGFTLRAVGRPAPKWFAVRLTGPPARLALTTFGPENAPGLGVAATAGAPWFTDANCARSCRAICTCCRCAGAGGSWRNLAAAICVAVGRALMPPGPPLKLTLVIVVLATDLL